ncbi:sensor histidine kinase [Pseudoduganella lutea]|uniref:sensor histidine kinase n=1 Tax=Pseudoduganella lutea TaxID=321985 RepID=UPI001E5ADB4C|nr:sensor histidine kinase [Pseudoduganella lutea]
MNQAADAMLSQTARTLSRQVQPTPTGLLVDFPRAAQEVLEADPKDRLLYTVSSPPGRVILGNKTVPHPPKNARLRENEPYFYDAELMLAEPGAGATAGARIMVRVAALYVTYDDPDGRQQAMLVQVARNMAHRENLWKRILVDTLLPLSVLIVLMTIIVWVGSGAGLAPLVRLRREVEGRTPMDLTPLRSDAAPQEVRSLVQALNALLASIRQNVASQQRFIADAAHQLRTPLAGLQSQTQLALRTNSDPALASCLSLVHGSAVRSAHLVDRLLMLARAEPEAAMATEQTLVEVLPFVKGLVTETVPRALRALIDLGIEETTDSREAVPLRVMGNELLLREALLNIVDNAIEYAGPGSEITVQVKRQGDRALVTIVDTGPGIPVALHERVLERFVRATDKGLGCGLGLAIVREIALRHHGDVVLSNVEPHGLKVAFSLPLATPRP